MREQRSILEATKDLMKQNGNCGRGRAVAEALLIAQLLLKNYLLLTDCRKRGMEWPIFKIVLRITSE